MSISTVPFADDTFRGGDPCSGAGGHGLPAGDGLWVPLAQGPLEDGQRPLVQLCRLRVVAVRSAQHRQVIKCHRDIGMVRAQELNLERQSAAVERLGLHGVALPMV
jgi:hypothetical protein